MKLNNYQLAIFALLCGLFQRDGVTDIFDIMLGITIIYVLMRWAKLCDKDFQNAL